MTLHHDFDRLLRLIGVTIWLLMLMAFCAELGAILGWFLGEARRSACIGVLMAGAFWVWFLYRSGGRPKS